MRFLYALPVLCIVSACVTHQVPSPTESFVVHQRIELYQRSDGLEGSLEVLRDRRLTSDDIAKFGQHDPDTNPTNDHKFSNTPLAQARLELKSADGRTLSSLQLEKPYATILTVQIAPFYRAILLTQDFSAGMGSYNGPITKIIEVSDGSLKWATARTAIGRPFEISLMRSLKSAWNFSTSSGIRDILSVSCRPDSDHFVTSFSRYRYDGHSWTVSSLRENLYWEAEDGDEEIGFALPKITQFPVAASR